MLAHSRRVKRVGYDNAKAVVDIREFNDERYENDRLHAEREKARIVAADDPGFFAMSLLRRVIRVWTQYRL